MWQVNRRETTVYNVSKSINPPNPSNLIKIDRQDRVSIHSNILLPVWPQFDPEHSLKIESGKIIEIVSFSSLQGHSDLAANSAPNR